MKHILPTIVVMVVLLFTPAYTNFGMDLADLHPTSTYDCLKKGGASFAIIRAYHSYGALDANAVQGLKNAKQAGLATHIYMFPCRGKDAKTQVNDMMNGVTGSLYSEVWIDVETNPSSGCSWASFSSASNCVYLGELIAAVKAKGKSVGIYSSTYMWQTIFGSKTACPGVAADAPIWYAHYDSNPSFSDFSAFGGWTKPTIKQYNGDVTVCGADVDKNYRP